MEVETMKRILTVTLMAAALLAGGVAAFAQKPRIAVLKIGNKSEYWHGTLGPAIEDWMVDGLVQSGKFRVVERQELDSILAEQHLSLSGAVDDKTAVEVAKLLGCQLMVLGAVTDFSIHKSGGAVGWGIGVDVSKTKAEGTLNVRLVNTTTAEIIWTGSEKGEHSFSKVFVAGSGGGVDWDESSARQIFEPAVQSIVAKIVASTANIKESLGAAAALKGKVAKVSEGKVYISIGSTDGVKEGDQYSVFHLGEAITDPDTGKVLGQDKTRIGMMTITKVVGEHLSMGVVDGGAMPQTGDSVEK
jgi:curli biogenesis system outer membrane secretion channel CsgG